MLIGNKEFNLKEKAYIMGILNVTPDSFSDGGKFNDLTQALKHAEQMVLEGADIIDIGGESTRPNYIHVSAEEEIERVIPVIKELKKHFDTPISIDTYKAIVARASLEAGADLVNDIWGLKQDVNMASTIQEYNVPVCIMHNREQAVYDNFMEDVLADLKESVQIGLDAGIKSHNLIIDPGVGFAKTYEMNLMIMNHLEELHRLSLPILLGTSRKSLIGLTLKEPVENRLAGTLATTVIGVMKGCSIIRVHDVLENKRAIQMTEAILNSKELADGSDKNIKP